MSIETSNYRINYLFEGSYTQMNFTGYEMLLLEQIIKEVTGHIIKIRPVLTRELLREFLTNYDFSEQGDIDRKFLILLGFKNYIKNYKNLDARISAFWIDWDLKQEKKYQSEQ